MSRSPRDPFEDLVGQAADPRKVLLAQRLEERRVRRRRGAIRTQLSTVPGREFVWNLLTRAHLFEDITGTPEEVYRALGRRAAGLELLAECQDHPDHFNAMWAEGQAREREERDELERALKDDDQEATT